jgi:type I site-specific restriction endonuclease
VTPKLVAAGWELEPHLLAEQHTFTDGRIVVAGTKAKRLAGKRPDYVLRYTPDLTIAVVEAKRGIDDLTLLILWTGTRGYTPQLNRKRKNGRERRIPEHT